MPHSSKPQCRICKSDIDNRILLLEGMPLTDDFVNKNDIGRKEYIHDIEIHQCPQCGIVQNPKDFDHEAYYDDYQYSSGNSDFTKNFMASYAREVVNAFHDCNGHHPESVVEIGSGDGQQLKQFALLGISKLKGIEPSNHLAEIADSNGIDTTVALFGKSSLGKLPSSYDICISSYTFDHVRNPIEYLESAHGLLADNGILALEIHDLETIIKRTEYCLFEHEHTTYLTDRDIKFLLENTGYAVLSINPLPPNVTRGNSLIIVAKKSNRSSAPTIFSRPTRSGSPKRLQKTVDSTINRIDDWIKKLPDSTRLVGFGAGGRGIMTLAALSNHMRFDAIFDSNYISDAVLTPKTRIPVVGPDQWNRYSDATCMVFSFGYFDEISKQLEESGFSRNKIVSLLDFYP